MEPEIFLHTGEDTGGEKRDARADADTHQQDPPNQAYG